VREKQVWRNVMRTTLAVLLGAAVLAGCSDGEAKLGGVAVKTICDTVIKENLAASIGVSAPSFREWEEGKRRTAARLSITVDQVDLALADDCGRKK
jgi:hypothetical protein